MFLFDLDEAPSLNSWLLGIDRVRPLSFEARHHLAGDGRSLRDQVRDRLAVEGIEAGGPIRLLCMPAVFGQVFNPLSVYFCHAQDGALSAILYEVNNTFGGRHAYVVRAPSKGGNAARHSLRKTFRVSPFLDMDLSYEFAITLPGERAALAIRVCDGEGVILRASFAGAAEPITNRSLAGVLVRHPLLMLEVLGAIHWEALKMLFKGIRFEAGSSRRISEGRAHEIAGQREPA
jgi:DUF1365 family protein